MSAKRNRSSGKVARPRKVAFGQFELWESAIRRHLAPRYAPSFVDLSQARLEDFAAVIPLQILHYPPLELHPKLLGLKFFHPSPAVVSLCDDKLRLAEFLIEHGFAEFVPPLRSSGPPYPYVWKKRCSWWGLDCYIVRGPEDERDLDLHNADYFAQEVVPGEAEFAAHILRTGGQIRYASTYIHQMATPLFVNGRQGSPVRSIFRRGCPHLEIFSNILERLDFEGTACIDYKVVAGRPVLFEINPRFGGSLCSDITAYLDAYLGALKPQSRVARLQSTLARLTSEMLARFH